jgi:hypothetical protein
VVKLRRAAGVVVPAALACAAAALLAAVICGAPVAAAAPAAVVTPSQHDFTAPPLGVSPAPGSGGWYWPIGSEDFGSYAGFLAPRGRNVHVAQDMHAKRGSPVYAVGDGTVWIARADAGGYGPNGTPGGCIIIVHRTGAGEEFRALYGHVSKLLVKDGERVTAGQRLAVVNGCDHLHFGIHPDEIYRGKNPYAGEVPKSWKDHGGFVDPVEYLRSHPRGASYAAPALPVFRIKTGAEPAGFGAAAGVAYWTETTGTAPGTYAVDLAGGERRALAAGEAPPPFDAARYPVSLLAAPAVGFAVRDRLPVLTLAAASEAPAWGTPVRLTGSLTNAATKPFLLAGVRLERLAGSTWKAVATARTDADGAVTFAYTPATRTTLRVSFLLPADQPAGATYVAPEAPEVAVAPKVRLSAPVVPAAVALRVPAAFSGTLVPRHAAGDAPVRLEFQRLKEGAWAAAKTVKVTVADAAAGSAYSAAVSLSAAGSWRVRAVHPADAAHAATSTEWRVFTVR